ncbi:KIDINS220 [Symbiodinium sp. CCMP2592]|nr:KIDINS220 [Symbiodinium sp. CCMP2592]
MLRMRMLSGEEVASVPAGEEVANVRALKLVLNKQHGFAPRFRQRLFLRGDLLEDAFELATSADMVLEFVVLDFANVSPRKVEKLIRAARSAKLSKVESMLQLPQDPNLTSQSGKTALASAVSANHLEIARVLVEAGSRVDAAVSHYGLTPLSIAVTGRGGSVAMVQFLLEAGANIDSRNTDGTTALALAAAYGCTEVVRLLLLEGAGVDLTDHINGWTALTSASSLGHAEIVQVLLEFGSNVHHMCRAGTALTLASFSGHDAIVRLLLQHRAQVEDHAVFAASNQGHVNCVHLMLAAQCRRKVLTARSSFRRRLVCSVSLTRASRHGHANLVQVLLEAHADMETRTPDFTALMEASLYSRVDVVRVLLKASADKDATDRDGTTALMLSSMTGNAEIVRMLLKAGADRNLVSKDGSTAMMEATSWGHIEVMGLLKPRKRKRETLS